MTSTYLCAWMATVVTGTQWNKSHTDQKVIGIAGDGIHASTTLATGTEVKTYFREDTNQGKKLGRGSLLVLFELSHALTADVTLNKVMQAETPRGCVRPLSTQLFILMLSVHSARPRPTGSVM